MAFLNDLINRVQSLNISDMVEQVVEQSETAIEDLQREQMLHGEDSRGEKIGTYKNAVYSEVKHRMNPLAGEGYVDLRKTTSFYSKITASIVGDELVIDSYDSKTPEIVAQYGERIFGLNAEFKRRAVTQEIRPRLYQNIKLHLRFGS